MEESFSERASEKLMNIVENLKTPEEFLDFLERIAQRPQAFGLSHKFSETPLGVSSFILHSKF